MNRLTAIRTFAAPGFSPAKRTKIFNDKWYKVTFQNVERDPRTDYVGLGEGEYVQLLPGHKAREARDARLNHCNRVTEWDGEVWEVYVTQYGHMRQHPTYLSTCESCELTVELARREHQKWLDDVAREREKHVAALANKPSDIWRQSAISDCDRILLVGMSTFNSKVTRIR